MNGQFLNNVQPVKMKNKGRVRVTIKKLMLELKLKRKLSLNISNVKDPITNKKEREVKIKHMKIESHYPKWHKRKMRVFISLKAARVRLLLG
jgi:hypothetical protein